MPRKMLTDKSWDFTKEILLETNKCEHHSTFEGILYRMRTGIQWRDLPKEFGSWNTIFRRFNLWSKKGILTKLFEKLSSSHDTQWIFIDGSIVKAHQDSCGARHSDNEAIGKSVAGNTTKIHLAVDSGGLPVYFELSGGNVHDIAHAENLINALPSSEVVTADNRYDSDELRSIIEALDSQANISRKKNSKAGNQHMDWCLYKYRHLVEKTFIKIKTLSRNSHSIR